MHKSCPECYEELNANALKCKCGYRFREMGFGWTKGLGDWSFPKSAGAWSVILLACPLTIGFFGFLSLLGWFDLRAVGSAVLFPAMLLLPIGAHLMPTSRLRGGGCCLGCLTWVSMCIGVSLAGLFVSFGDPVLEAEVPPIARISPGPCLVSGIGLHQEFAQVEKRFGPFKPISYPYAKGIVSQSYQNEQGVVVTIVNNLVARVQGRTLEQGGEVLVESGQPRSRISHIFEPSTYATRKQRHTHEGAVFEFHLKKGDIDEVAMTSVGRVFFHGPSPLTVDGIPLGVLKLELGEGKAEGDKMRYGETLVSFDDSGRSYLVVGTSVEYDGETIAKVGGDVEMFRPQKYLYFTNFKGASVKVIRDGSIDGPVQFFVIRSAP